MNFQGIQYFKYWHVTILMQLLYFCPVWLIQDVNKRLHLKEEAQYIPSVGLKRPMYYVE